MAYIAGLVVVGFFFLSLHYFTELSKSQKVTVTAIVLAIVLSAIAFNAYSASQRVSCNGIDVNNSNYTLSVGTYTFIGKKDTPNYGQMISASSCE